MASMCHGPLARHALPQKASPMSMRYVLTKLEKKRNLTKQRQTFTRYNDYDYDDDYGYDNGDDDGYDNDYGYDDGYDDDYDYDLILNSHFFYSLPSHSLYFPNIFPKFVG